MYTFRKEFERKGKKASITITLNKKIDFKVKGKTFHEIIVRGITSYYEKVSFVEDSENLEDILAKEEEDFFLSFNSPKDIKTIKLLEDLGYTYTS
ncbi:hypothetical protein T190115A13A_60194 [Tenacibaculum sp. 190524A02b]|uniref:Uncharacterized protein n=1 Tax=Tenacibaculum vairaonense TaxID=3137860 RepID=A0ABP1FES0_9FLAO